MRARPAAAVETPALAAALSTLAAEGGIGLVLDLGAGEAPGLEACLAAGAAHVALVEPNPALEPRLARRIAAHPQVSLHACAVAEHDGAAALQVFNLGPLSSLRAPADLTGLFPGLRRTAAPEVATCDPAGLLARLPPPGPAPDLLVIDTPGEEATVIERLAAAGALARFGLVLLRCGTTAHYRGSLPAAALGRRLEELGWRCTATDAAEDPDRPWFTFRPDPRAQELAALKAALAAERTAAAARGGALEAALAAARTRIAGLERSRDEARAAAAELRGAEAVAEAERQAAAVLADAERRAGETTAALQVRLTETIAARDAMARARDEAATTVQARDGALVGLRKRIGELEAALDKARTASAAAEARGTGLETAATAARERIAALETALAAARDRAAGAEAGAAAARRRIAELEAAVVSARSVADEARAARDRAVAAARAAVEEEVAQLRGDAATALRLQAQREADLQDLRLRHARLAAEKARQDALLQALTERLTQAAQYLQRLEPDPDAAVPAQLPVPVAEGAGKADRKKHGKKRKGKAGG